MAILPVPLGARSQRWWHGLVSVVHERRSPFTVQGSPVQVWWAAQLTEPVRVGRLPVVPGYARRLASAPDTGYGRCRAEVAFRREA